MNVKSIVLTVTILLLSTQVNAVILNTLNGVSYQWLELTETQGLSRDAVELRLTDVNDALYGYEYASRQLLEDLLLSYTDWDGVSGWRGAHSLPSDINAFINDFGATVVIAGDGIDKSFTTVDGYEVFFDYTAAANGLYGTRSIDNCPGSKSCYSGISLAYDVAGNPTMTYQHSNVGYDASYIAPHTAPYSSGFENIGSYLVKFSTVPVPAAAWLFGSGLIGLVGMARRKKA